jgi:tRNA nucleotidyltransferase (CCA-adding enzyme)
MTSIGEDVSGSRVLERLRELAGGNELLAAAREHDGEVELVGGAVRDILLGGLPRELDVVVEGDVRAFVEDLGSRVDGVASAVVNTMPPARARGIGEMEAPVEGNEASDDGDRRDVGGPVELTYHERFHTAVMRWSEGEIDIAMRRSETYAAPGALPEVAPGSAQQDLERRDFTVNAIAVALAGEQAGRLRSVEGALDDLAARRLRVLHDASFSDDPTRILRLVRYAARLGFEIEPHTSDLLTAAIDAGALRTLSGQRLGAELRLALSEPEPLGALAELQRLGVLRAWQPGVSFDEALARTALRALPEDGSVRLLLAASLLLDLCHELGREETEPAMRGFLYDIELPAGEGDRVFGMAVSAVFTSDHVDGVEMLSEVLEMMLGTPVESLALAAASCELRDGPGSYGVQVIDEWLNRRRHITLELTGGDLLAAGVPEGPEVGARLEESHRLLLEERIEPGRESELRAALEAKI